MLKGFTLSSKIFYVKKKNDLSSATGFHFPFWGPASSPCSFSVPSLNVAIKLSRILCSRLPKNSALQVKFPFRLGALGEISGVQLAMPEGQGTLCSERLTGFFLGHLTSFPGPFLPGHLCKTKYFGSRLPLIWAAPSLLQFVPDLGPQKPDLTVPFLCDYEGQQAWHMSRS